MKKYILFSAFATLAFAGAVHAQDVLLYPDGSVGVGTGMDGTSFGVGGGGVGINLTPDFDSNSGYSSGRNRNSTGTDTSTTVDSARESDVLVYRIAIGGLCYGFNEKGHLRGYEGEVSEFGLPLSACKGTKILKFEFRKNSKGEASCAGLGKGVVLRNLPLDLCHAMAPTTFKRAKSQGGEQLCYEYTPDGAMISRWPVKTEICDQEGPVRYGMGKWTSQEKTAYGFCAKIRGNYLVSGMHVPLGLCEPMPSPKMHAGWYKSILGSDECGLLMDGLVLLGGARMHPEDCPVK